MAGRNSRDPRASAPALRRAGDAAPGRSEKVAREARFNYLGLAKDGSLGPLRYREAGALATAAESPDSPTGARCPLEKRRRASAPARESSRAALAYALAAGAAVWSCWRSSRRRAATRLGLAITAASAFALAVGIETGAERIPDLVLPLLTGAAAARAPRPLLPRRDGDACPLLYLGRSSFPSASSPRRAAIAMLAVAIASCAAVLAPDGRPPGRGRSSCGCSPRVALTGAGAAVIDHAGRLSRRMVAVAGQRGPHRPAHRAGEPARVRGVLRAGAGARPARRAHSSACWSGDLDSFKQVNDRYGHQAGDRRWSA